MKVFQLFLVVLSFVISQGGLLHIWSFEGNFNDTISGFNATALGDVPFDSLDGPCGNHIHVGLPHGNLSISNDYTSTILSGDFLVSFIVRAGPRHDSTSEYTPVVSIGGGCANGIHLRLQNTGRLRLQFVSEHALVSLTTNIGNFYADYHYISFGKQGDAFQLWVNQSLVDQVNSTASSTFYFLKSIAVGRDLCNNANTTSQELLFDELQIYDSWEHPASIFYSECLQKPPAPKFVNIAPDRTSGEIGIFNPFYLQFTTFTIIITLIEEDSFGIPSSLSKIYDVTNNTYELDPTSKYRCYFKTYWPFSGNFLESPAAILLPTVPPTLVPTTTISTSSTLTTGCVSSEVGHCGDKNDNCTYNNGGCDFRVKCSVSSNNEIVCHACPNGTHGNGYQCNSLCGDGICNASLGEHCVNCAEDCVGPCGECGDHTCDNNEDCSSCAEDCACLNENLLSCPSECNQRGACVGGVCHCTVKWSGPSCNSQNEPIQPIFNETNPEVVVNVYSAISHSFSISVRKIEEININNIPQRPAINIRDGFTLVKVNNTTYKYNTILENKAGLNVTVYHFSEQEAIVFAGETFTFPGNTLKIIISIQNWPFLSIENRLKVVIDNKDVEEDTNSCVKSHSSENGELKWILLSIGGVSLYGQFLNGAVVDGRIRNISFKENDDNTISAILPHFWNTIELDPHYSVLLGEEECKKEKMSNVAVIAIIVSATVVGVAVLVMAIFFYIQMKKKKARKQRNTRQLHQLHEYSGPVSTP